VNDAMACIRGRYHEMITFLLIRFNLLSTMTLGDISGRNIDGKYPKKYSSLN